MMKMVSIGIDPGIHGGVVACDERRTILCCEDTPVRKGARGQEYDIASMHHLLSRLAALNPSARVTIERQQVMRSPDGASQGTIAAFSTGFGYGIWRGIIVACGLPSDEVPPQTWTSMMLRGMVGSGKARSIALARILFPGIELTSGRGRTPKDGRADAACLAYYGLKMMEMAAGRRAG